MTSPETLALTVWLYIGLVAWVINKIGHAIQDHNNDKNKHHIAVPDKYQTIFDIADAVVAEYDPIKDMSNPAKKAEATAKVQEQAKADGKPITNTVAGGAVEMAVKKRSETTTPSEAESLGSVDEN